MFSGCDGIKERIGLWFAFSPELFSMTSIKLSNNNYAQRAKSIEVFLFGKKIFHYLVGLRNQLHEHMVVAYGKVFGLVWTDSCNMCVSKWGDGERVRLWQDKWCGNFFLQVLYPDGNACVVARDAAVHSALVDGEGWSWNVRFHRGFNDWELEQVHSILYLLSTNSPRGCDKMRRGLNGSNRVAVCSFYEAIQGKLVTSFPWNSIWYVKAPKQVSLSVWIVAWGKILVIIS